MLRWVIALLVAANAGYFLWTQGHLARWGWAPPVQSEPERLGTQVAPDALRLLDAPPPVDAPAAPDASPATPGPAPGNGAPPPASEPPAADPRPPAPAAPNGAPAVTPISQPGTTPLAPSGRTGPTAASPDTACWQAGAFTEAQASVLRAALTQLDPPPGSWQLTESRVGGRWIVYMGRYDNQEALERKKAELRELKVVFRVVTTPGMGPGLSLGTYSTEAAARQGLQDVMRAGVRTARVAQERAESRSFLLRLPSATSAQRAAVLRLGNALAGKTLEPCR
jgi:hypothetical protein